MQHLEKMWTMLDDDQEAKWLWILHVLGRGWVNVPILSSTVYFRSDLEAICLRNKKKLCKSQETPNWGLIMTMILTMQMDFINQINLHNQLTSY